MNPPRRITMVAAFAAIVVAGFVVRGPSDDAEPNPSPPVTSSPTSPPSAVPLETFCAAFEAMAAAHSNHLTNNTDASRAEVGAAGVHVLNLAPGTVMPPLARDGLTDFVNGVIGRETDPPPPEGAADAFSTFLEVACKPGL